MLEIREDQGIFKIGGYINVTNRDSKILKDKNGKSFIEQVQEGVFKEALNDAKIEAREIPLLYRHKELIVKNPEIREDHIGLRFDAEVDMETYNKVKDENLQCSFGFTPLKQKVEDISKNLYRRTLEKIKLLEVTITPNPAYTGSLVEIREDVDIMTREEILALIEDLQKQLEKLDTDKIDTVEEIKLASDEEVRVDPVTEVAKQELEEEKLDQEEDKIETPAEIEIAEVDVEIALAEKLEKELMVEKMQMQLELLKLKGIQ